MRPLSSLCEGPTLIVIDASTAINLNATGMAPEVLRAIPHQVVLPETVLAELQAGSDKGRNDYELTTQLISEELMAVTALGEAGWRFFETLVVGEAIATLDDGEAATIAHALETVGIAVVDERKARRICGQQFPNLRLATSMDVLSHPEVEQALGQKAMSDAIFSALVNARMRITPSYLPWAVKIIGTERASICRSLPNSVRQQTGSRNR